MLNYEQVNKSFILQQMDFFFNLGLGGVYNTDKLDMYPSVDILYTFHYRPLTKTYPGIAAAGTIGLDYNVNGNFAIRAGAGYQFVSMNVYNSSSWVAGSYMDSTAAPASQNAGGIIYTLSAGIKL